MNIEKGKFVELINKGVSLDLVYLLTLSRLGEDITEFTEPRIQALVSTLNRKGYIAGNMITIAGNKLIDSLKEDSKEVILSRAVKKEDEWDRFLKHYPPNDKFVWKSKLFEGDRSIRNNTKDGKLLFTNVLNSGEYNCDDLIGAVVSECLGKFETSYSSGTNKMKYFVNTETYLRQKLFVNWVEEGRGVSAEDLKRYFEAYSRKKTFKSSKTVDI